MAVTRESLRKDDTIAYTVPGSSQELHGKIVHIGIGLAARQAVWVRCIDGYSKGLISYVMLSQIVGVTEHANG